MCVCVCICDFLPGARPKFDSLDVSCWDFWQFQEAYPELPQDEAGLVQRPLRNQGENR